jgi:hypothetical protein
VAGVDTASFTMTVDATSTPSYVTLTPLVSLADMQAKTGLSNKTRLGQTFLITSTTLNDPGLVANGFFDIVSLPSATDVTYVLKPRFVRGVHHGARALWQIKYAAPETGPCVSGNDIYQAPGNAGNYANALIYQVVAVDPTTGFLQLQPTVIRNVLGYRPVHASDPC